MRGRERRAAAATVLCVMVLAAVLLAGLAFAQPAPGPSPIPAPNVVVIGTGLIGYIFMGVVTPFVVWGIRGVLPRLPRIVVLALPYVLTQIATFVGAWIAGGIANPYLAAVAGGLAHVLNEIITTLGEHGFS